jgi:hypothetical protein
MRGLLACQRPVVLDLPWTPAYIAFVFIPHPSTILPDPIFKVRPHLVDVRKIPRPVCRTPSRSTGVSNTL